MSTLYWVEAQDVTVTYTKPTTDDDTRHFEVEVVTHLGMLW